MTNSRDDHQQAVGFAGLKIRELINRIHEAREFTENEVVPIVMDAAGANPASTAAQNAVGLMAHISETLQELCGVGENGIEQMNEYSQGF